MFPAIIDATDAQIVVASAPVRTLTADEASQRLGAIEADLPLIAQRVQRHSAGLIYAVVEYGFALLRAREVHRVLTVTTRPDGQFKEQETGFIKWREERCDGISEATSYRYMNAAENAGLSAESEPGELQMLRDQDKLAGKKLADLYKKRLTGGPGKLEASTAEELEAERLAELREAWRKWADQTQEQGIAAQDWADLGETEREALCGLAHEVYQLLKSSLRKPKPVPATPAAKPMAIDI